MSERWAERQRCTNRLVRIIANYILAKPNVSPDQIYGLCKLTWITKSYSDENAKYIESTKIPALGDIFGRDYSGLTLQKVATDISRILQSPEALDLVLSHTGFTNFYLAYRNTARQWISDNFEPLLPLFRVAYSLNTDEQGLRLIEQIERLPGIPKANHEEIQMRPEFLLTPAFFALDQRLRFPLINGNEGVQNLLHELNVKDASLASQYKAMIGLYGKGGISDAADLDQVRGILPAISGENPTQQLLQEKPADGNDLPLKDESDIESLQAGRKVVSKRKHNELTNQLKHRLSGYTLLEGRNKDAQFDALVKNYNREKNGLLKDDLLIEVKSSIEIAHIRMAIGQLYSYWFHLKGKKAKPHLAILLPEEPDTEAKQLLNWLHISILWFSGDTLETCSSRLKGFVVTANSTL